MANKASPEHVSKYYHDIAAKFKIDLNTPARVVVARDTRASGARLLGCLQDGLAAAGAEVKDYGFLTTPQLHYMVRCLNTEGTKDAYGTPTEKGYYEKFGAAFKTALRGKKPSGSLTVDGANGVGGPKLKELIKYLPSKDEGGLEIFVINDNVIKPESLNVDVSQTTSTCLESFTDRHHSAVRTTSRPTSVLLLLPKPGLATAAHPSMAMLTVSCITSRTSRTFSASWTVIALRPLLHLS
jgi:phosphomannomutase